MDLPNKRPVGEAKKTVATTHYVFLVENSEEMQKKFNRDVGKNAIPKTVKTKEDLVNYALDKFVEEKVIEEVGLRRIDSMSIFDI